jgi:hypothetical protein
MTCDPFLADEIADACQDGTLMPATMYVQLCTTAPGKTTAGTAATGLDRVAVVMADDWTNDAAGKLTSDTKLDFGQAITDLTGVQWAELYDAATSGQRYLYGTLPEAYAIPTGAPVSFEAGDLTITVAT